jgi:hypothetical protein
VAGKLAGKQGHHLFSATAAKMWDEQEYLGLLVHDLFV